MFQMSLIVLGLIAASATVTVAGLSLAVYAALPEKFLAHADAGRYAGLTASSTAAAALNQTPVHIGSLQDQSA
jgi:hypothetical protein